MTTNTTKTLTPASHALLARQHANLMFTYYLTRALLESGAFAQDAECVTAAAHRSAVESRRAGFALEREVEKAGVMLGDYDEDLVRREAYRAAQLHQSDPSAALEVQRRTAEAVVASAVGCEEQRAEYPRAA